MMTFACLFGWWCALLLAGLVIGQLANASGSKGYSLTVSNYFCRWRKELEDSQTRILIPRFICRPGLISEDGWF